MNILFSSLFKKLIITAFILCVLGGIVFLAWPGTIERLDIISSNPNPLIRHFAPTWRSLKRIIDLPHMFFYAMRGSNLPVYELTFSKRDKGRLFENLPDYPRVQAMWEEYKKTVKAEFRMGDYYTNDAKIRNRGVSPPHWNAVKKSWQINLPNEYPLEERTTLRLFLPEDKGWIFGSMNSMRARELDLISLQHSYARLHINKTDMGIYLLVEGWEESMLEKNKRGIGPIFSNLNLNIHDVDLLRPDSIHIWENRFAKETPVESQAVLAYFLDLIANAPDDIFANALPHIVNMDTFYHWMIITSLSGNFHQGNGANQNWYFNSGTGKLEPVLFDSALTVIEIPLSLENNRLVNRTMQIPEFKKTFTTLLQEYLADESHKERALAFYDKTLANIRKDILSDTKKIQTSTAVLDRIAVERGIVAANYSILAGAIAESNSINFAYANETYPLTNEFNTDTYANTFLAWNTPASEFLTRHPQFEKRANNVLALKPRTHVFRTTVIVPEGYTFVIDPGARLVFAPGVSLFSYSRVESRGTASRPVTLQALDAKKPWGVFAILGAPGANVFTYTHITDGNDATFTGMYFSGSLSVRSSDLIFTNGFVAHSRADDGIHVYNGEGHIMHTTFEQTTGDSIDIDFARGNSLFEKNIFNGTGPGGDAMDISFSTITIRNNTVTHCGDKGVSVGESSTAHIEQNTIIGCAYGIAVKDRSRAEINDNILLANNIGIGLYRKKPHFVKGGYADVQNSIIWNNTTQVSADGYSSIAIENSVIKNGFAGTGNTAAEPPLTTILPAGLFDVFQKTL